MTEEANHHAILASVHACDICLPQLPHGCRPVLQLHPDAGILIAGQAPGARVHSSGVPFDDASGKRLREWLNIDCDTFYNPCKVAILPMSFCYPGKGNSGDLPPLPICAETWRSTLLECLRNVKLTLLIGAYAQQWHLDPPHKTLTETVAAWQDYPESVMPLPHPSPRNNIWLKRNPWFEEDVIPQLRTRVTHALSSTNLRTGK